VGVLGVGSSVEPQEVFQNHSNRLLCSDGSSPRVLLAEDSGAARILTAALLSRMGCKVDAVEHGEEAVLCARANDYDIIVLDIEMPVMDGVSAAKEIRALGGDIADTPIVAFSAFLADTAKSGSVQSVFDQTLAKPAGRHAIRTTLERALREKTARRAPPLILSQKPEMGAGRNYLVDAEGIRQVRSNLPEAVWSGLVDTAMGEVRESLIFAESALEAMDWECLHYHCHKIKGIARTFAAPQMACLAETIEQHAFSGKHRELSADLADLRTCADRTLAAISVLRAI
jgi:CheY-like chemotaxis protein/HPt (histidine-containing phosphotransfer) domain-containing protein